MTKPNNQPSFTCYCCDEINYYNISDYTDNNKGRELLMEMLTYKTKDVTIVCKNPECKCTNTITITYI